MASTFSQLFKTNARQSSHRGTVRKTTQLEVEGLEERLVPAFVKPGHDISPQTSAELVRGESSLRSGQLVAARGSFQMAYDEAAQKHDVQTLLRVAEDYRLLGNAAGKGYGDFAAEKNAYENAINSAAFWAYYNANQPDSGDDRAYGINMLQACISAFPRLQKATAEQWDLKSAKDGAVSSLATLNHQSVFDVVQGTWYADNGQTMKFFTSSIVQGQFLLSQNGRGYTFGRGGSIPDVSVQEGGAWNATPGHFETVVTQTPVTGEFGTVFQLTFTFDPRNSGRMLVQDGTGASVEIYRKWDQAPATPTTGGTTTADIDKIVERVNKLSAADAAKELWKLDWDRLMGALGKMGEKRVAQIVSNFSTVQHRADTLARMAPDQAARVAWNFSTWKEMTDVLDKMDAKRVAQIVWNYSWKDMTNTLNHMAANRVAEVIWNLNTWGELKSTISEMRKLDPAWTLQVLDQMPADRVARLITNCYKDNPTELLNGMTAQRAAEVIWKFTTWKEVTDALDKMTDRRAAEVIWNFKTWKDLSDTLNLMAPKRVADIIHNVSLVNRIKTLDQLKPAVGAEVIKLYSWAGRAAMLEGMSVTSAAKFLMQYDVSLRSDMLNHLSAARRNQLVVALRGIK